jgi:GNAT superfamily N-acetyltransferase
MTRIRPMTEADAARVADLVTQLGYPTDPSAAVVRIRDIVNRAGHAALVAVGPDDGPIGWIHVERAWSLAEDGQVVIAGLVVDEAHRSGGVGSELVAAAEAWAREQGLEQIAVRTRTTRHGAHRFYEREGFHLVKESRVYARRLD